MSNLTPNRIYWALGAGIAVGAASMAAVLNGGVVRQAHAGPSPDIKTISSIAPNDMATLRSLDSSFAGLAEYVAPSVVHIKSESQISRDGAGRLRTLGGQGSGVIYRPDGYIITNDHVVAGFEAVTVVLKDGREFKGKVIGAPDSDIAVVKIEATGLPAAEFGDSGKVRPGQFAVAVGSPFGLENSVTIGHVSGLGRSSAIPDARLNGFVRQYPDLIQTDASINMGNSGGPLLNVEGEVIGINTAIFSETGGSVGIGFAIPANQARLIADLLIQKGKIERGFLGLLPENLKEYQKAELKVSSGAFVADDPQPGGPADKAGIKKGDVIVRIGTHEIRNQLDLRNAMLRYAPGTKVPIELVREGARKTVEVTVAELPAHMRAPKPGEAPRTQPNARTPRQFSPEIPEELRKRLEELHQNPEMFRDLDPFFFDRERSPNAPEPSESRPRLGVGVEDANARTRKEFDLPEGVEGVVVISVAPGSVAQRYGIEVGDVIQEFGGKKIKSASELVKAMEASKSGDRLQVKTLRVKDGVRLEKSLDVTLR
ncbi:MAG TPA: trypsin-like peptidase domain-containing protein [Fimbriimonadaceae bacterium]|nr:trypsin-like peptidase domain-containing protein [Fimbriimonadaceae bacterium]